MYLLAHAMAGILVGIVLAAIVGDRRVVALAALGAVLPDLIDKPLGHIFLAGTVNYGRIYFHGLTVLFLVLIAGLLLYRYRGQVGHLAVAAGMASHQFLDAMWRHPVEWFWPFLGPLPRHDYAEDYFWDALLRELAQPSEWLFFFLIAGLFAYLYRRELGALLARLTDPSTRHVLVAALGLTIIAALVAGRRFLP
ncbi:metal-dependent hydrolase [Methanoculleus sp. Wushi-C6]|uniref:Metal-dependent hydrolase n=1 Tax=Methanoculleus caldifontis TaxID=2651577 RepID=A0ABU3WZ03_9EURY|nr:metal-dependent hydrolase [Methanoculleus sp. Wushi-C6]